MTFNEQSVEAAVGNMTVSLTTGKMSSSFRNQVNSPAAKLFI